MVRFKDAERGWQTWLASNEYRKNEYKKKEYPKANTKVLHQGLKLWNAVKKELAIEKEIWAPYHVIPLDTELGPESLTAYNNLLEFIAEHTSEKQEEF